MESITAEIRVTALTIKPFAYKTGTEEHGGETLEVRAAGFWTEARPDMGDNHYPISLHMTVYPGHGVVPAIGDCITVTVKRTSTEAT